MDVIVSASLHELAHDVPAYIPVEIDLSVVELNEVDVEKEVDVDVVDVDVVDIEVVKVVEKIVTVRE